MAFIKDTDLSVLNIRLTTKGREQLSRGRLTFKSFVIGDSEIDYDILKHKEEYYEIIGEEIDKKIEVLKPKDLNPQIISWLPKIEEGEKHTDILGVPSYRTVIKNNRDFIGVFNLDEETTHIEIKSELISGYGKVTNIVDRQFTLVDGNYTPVVGDYALIKPSTGLNYNEVVTSGNTITPDKYLFMKVEDVSGSSITLDRKISTQCNNFFVLFFKDSIGELLYGEYPSEYVFDNEVTAFLDNFNCIPQIFPYWKLSIIHTENIPGVDAFPDNLEGTKKSFLEYKTTKLAGFVSYIQNQKKKYKTLAVIHYTNPSPSNIYGEGFHKNTLEMILPTIMWDKKEDNEMGLKLFSSETEKQLIEEENSLNIKYYDLVDENENIVGKVFNGLNLIVIENQELIYAMAYKSNRNWTLSEPFFSLTS